MKSLCFIIFFISICIFSQSSANNILVKDLDLDDLKDTVYIDFDHSQIVSSLSTQKFKKIKSGEIKSLLDGESRLVTTLNGFELRISWMRAGYACQFRCNTKDEKIQLIGMSRYEFGSANNDGSGESSVNLLTGKYIGNWSYYDLRKEELIKIPTIKTKMIYKKIFLENFNEKVYFDYFEKCANLFNRRKNKIQKILLS